MWPGAFTTFVVQLCFASNAVIIVLTTGRLEITRVLEYLLITLNTRKTL